MDSEGGIVVIRNAEIDTRAPFRSVKEAVMLFGERVLAGEVYANKLKKMENGSSENEHAISNRLGTVSAELEETKQSLQKAREESMLMATCVSSLQEELERTKTELQKLKDQESEKQVMESEIEDLKFVEDNTTEFQVIKERTTLEGGTEFHKKRYVTFANPPSITEVIIPPRDVGDHGVLEKHHSLTATIAKKAKKKKKQQPLIPLIGGLFSKKKGSSEKAATPRV